MLAVHQGISVGSSCTGNNPNLCTPGAMCDGGICRVKLNGDCALHRDKCSSGSVCDRESGNKCKFPNGKKCTQTDDCVKVTVCDNLGTCKYALNHVCNNSSQCAAGAICDSTKRCKCDPRTKVNGALCAPTDGRAGSPCKIPTNSCTVAHSKCSSSTAIGTCVCDEGYKPITDYTCKLVPGQKCKEHADCVSRACESEVCRAQNGESCTSSDTCRVDSTCDIGDVCKIKVRKSCFFQPTQCQSGATCVASDCKLKLGQECTDDTYCAPSAVCSRNLHSKNVTVCNLRAGQRCLGDNSTLCTLGTLCTSDGVCRLEARQGCNVKARDPLCLSDAKCDPGKRQCRKVIGAECERDDECETNAVCDNSKRCKLGTGQACTNSPDLCLFGATCRNSKCSCIAGSTKTNSVKCDPLDRKVKGTCQTPANASVAKLDSGCDDDRASCVHGVCQCHDNYVTLRNYTCGAGPGVLCKNSSVRCAAGTVCDIIGVCRLDVGERCEGPLRPMCRIGTTCSEDHVCKAQLNGDCGSNPGMCSKGTVCDATDTCKIAQGEFCREDQVCVAGATCQGANDSSTGQCTCVSGVSKRNGDICDPADGRVGGRCSPSSGCNVSNAKCNPSTSKCECEDGFVREEGDFSCKLAVGKSCTKKDASCKTGMTCDSVAEQCRVNLGKQCDPESTDPCETNAICDDYGICKLDLNGNCSGSNVAHCKAGTFCDFQERCRYGSGQECNNTSREEQCVAGADCVDSTCVCNTEITTIVGVMCVPVTGRANAVCNDIDEPCEVSHSACVDGICVCVDGFLPTHDFACSPPSGVSTARESGGMLGLILALSAVALTLIGFGFIMYWRGRQKKKVQADLKAKGAASVHELKEMAAEVTSIIEEPSTSQVTSDVTSQFVSDVDSEVAASEVAVSEVSATDVASKVTSALAATEAPA